MELTGALSAIFTLIVLEVILSADNALILGVLVQRLPVHLRRKALFYGILGAYILRGLALLFASLVIQLWWAQAAPRVPWGPPGAPKGPGRPGKRFWTFSEKVVLGPPNPRQGLGP